jgi:hypothetical protein
MLAKLMSCMIFKKNCSGIVVIKIQIEFLYLINNIFLADVMYKLGAHTVLAVDVGAQDEQNFYNFGDQLSGKRKKFLF